MFAPEDLSDDTFLGGKLLLWQPLKGYRAATDPVLMAAAVPAKPGQSVLDLGCGAGTASLCLAARVPGLTLTGLELQPDYADLARRNADRAAIPFEVIEGDLTQMPTELLRGFDHVIANPPYYAATGSPSPDVGRDIALRGTTPMVAWVDAAARRLHPGGLLTMIVTADRLPEVLGALHKRLGSAVVLPLAPRINRAATRVIVQARKGGRSAFRLLAPLVMHEGEAHDGDRKNYSAALTAILADASDLSAQLR